jgi:hypothetical protein
VVAVRCFGISLLALGCAALAAGCGSKGGHGYSLVPTQQCLNKSGATASKVKNQLLPGSQGNLQVKFTYGTEDIYIVFGKNAAEAVALQNRAVTQTEINEHIDRNTILSGVTQTKNVFYYSDYGPLTAVGRQKITACLR